MVEILPNTLSFRIVHTIEVPSENDVPAGYTGRVRVVDDGVLLATAWFRDGRLDDPSPVTPAYTRHRHTGAAKQERHYRRGRLHDPGPGRPAVRGYFANGTVRYEEHFRYGRRHDAGPRPAIVKWRLDGSVRAVRHYAQGEQIERADAEVRRLRRARVG